jgi:predicted nucleotidyltransferase
MKPCNKNMANPTLSLRPEQLQELRRLIATHFPHEEVWAYGSRVTGTAHDTSDLVVRHPPDLQVKQSFEFWEFGLHWPDLDEDLSFRGILAGNHGQHQKV